MFQSYRICIISTMYFWTKSYRFGLSVSIILPTGNMKPLLLADKSSTRPTVIPNSIIMYPSTSFPQSAVALTLPVSSRNTQTPIYTTAILLTLHGYVLRESGRSGRSTLLGTSKLCSLRELEWGWCMYRGGGGDT